MITPHLPKSDINPTFDTIMKEQNKEKRGKNIAVGYLTTVKVREMDTNRDEEIISMGNNLVVCVEA